MIQTPRLPQAHNRIPQRVRDCEGVLGQFKLGSTWMQHNAERYHAPCAEPQFRELYEQKLRDLSLFFEQVVRPRFMALIDELSKSAPSSPHILPLETFLEFHTNFGLDDASRTLTKIRHEAQVRREAGGKGPRPSPPKHGIILHPFTDVRLLNSEAQLAADERSDKPAAATSAPATAATPPEKASVPWQDVKEYIYSKLYKGKKPWPGVNSLARELGCSPSTVTKAKKALTKDRHNTWAKDFFAEQLVSGRIATITEAGENDPDTSQAAIDSVMDDDVLHRTMVEYGDRATKAEYLRLADEQKSQFLRDYFGNDPDKVIEGLRNKAGIRERLRTPEKP